MEALAALIILATLVAVVVIRRHRQGRRKAGRTEITACDSGLFGTSVYRMNDRNDRRD